MSSCYHYPDTTTALYTAYWVFNRLSRNLKGSFQLLIVTCWKCGWEKRWRSSQFINDDVWHFSLFYDAAGAKVPCIQPIYFLLIPTQEQSPYLWTFKEPRNRFRQAGNRVLDSLKGLQIQALFSASPPPCRTSGSNAASPYTLPTPFRDRHAITSHLLATF